MSRQLDDLDADAFNHVIEGPRVLGVAVVNEVLATLEESDVGEGHFTCDLPHDIVVRRGRDHRDVDPSRTAVNEEENVEGNESAMLPDFLREKIGGSEDVFVRRDEVRVF